MFPQEENHRATNQPAMLVPWVASQLATRGECCSRPSALSHPHIRRRLALLQYLENKEITPPRLNFLMEVRAQRSNVHHTVNNRLDFTTPQCSAHAVQEIRSMRRRSLSSELGEPPSETIHAAGYDHHHHCASPHQYFTVLDSSSIQYCLHSWKFLPGMQLPCTQGCLRSRRTRGRGDCQRNPQGKGESLHTTSLECSGTSKT